MIVTENEFYKYADLIDICEINFFTLTKNCKISPKDEKINYLVEKDTISKEKMKIISRLIEFIIKQRKNLSFQMKNQIFLNK